MEYDDGLNDDSEPTAPLLPPDDRLWRHPSELGGHAGRGGSRAGLRDGRLLVVALLSGLTGALLAAGLVTAVGNFGTREVVRETAIERQQLALPAALDQERSPSPDVVEITKRVRPSLVRVVARGVDTRQWGTGVILRSDGLVLTSSHVLRHANRIEVVLHDGRTLAADLIGVDEDSDIAALRLTGEEPDGGYPTALLGTAATLELGEPAIAIGLPTQGGPTVTVGIVSALGREVQTGARPLIEMIEFDAPVTRGSSGGALVDDTGAVVGIVTAMGAVDAEGFSYATPIDLARMVADQLTMHGSVVHTWLGVEGEDVDRATSASIGATRGAIVRGVRGGSPADVAGIRAGDVIVAINGEEIPSMNALLVKLRARHPGDVVTLSVVRGERTRAVKALLRERPPGLND